MQSMHGIPTAPNSPTFSRIASVEPHGHEHDHEHQCSDHAVTDFSDFDMMSSVESLAREPWPRSGPPRDSIETVRSLQSSASSAPSSSTSSAPSTHTNHGFIMPSMPSLSEFSDDSIAATGLVGRLNIAVAGNSVRTKLIDVLCHEVFEPPRAPLGESSTILGSECRHHVCSSSRHEHNNITLVDCDVPSDDLALWLETQFRKAANSARQPGLDALLYVLDGEPDDKELDKLAQIQRFTAVVPVVPVHDPFNAAPPVNTEALLTRMRDAGLAPFLKRVWALAVEPTPNYDMTASAVENPGYCSHVYQPSELSQFTMALLGASGRARAHTSQLYARWVQAQLAVTSPEPPGALVVRVNLRKSLESIGNLDPLRLANWYMMPRVVGAVLAGMAAAVGLSAVWAKLIPLVSPPPAQCHRPMLLENWTEWLRI